MADNIVVITRIFNAPLERVWQACTDPEIIKKWWGPKDFTAPYISLDFRVGGKYLYAMHGPGGTEYDIDMWSTGTFTEIIPLKKIAYLDSFADKDGNTVDPSAYGMTGMPTEMQVSIEFETLADGQTKVTIHHTGPDTASEHAKNMTEGWSQTLDKLEQAIN